MFYTKFLQRHIFIRCNIFYRSGKIIQSWEKLYHPQRDRMFDIKEQNLHTLAYFLDV